MKKAGGIIAIIAGIFAVIAALVTLLAGGLGAAFNAEGGKEVIGLGWGGVVFSFLVIILGAIATGAKTKLTGILLIITSIAGAILGGSIVAIFMALALIGGILVLFGTTSKLSPMTDQNDLAPTVKKSPLKMVLVTLGIVIFGAMIISAVLRSSNKPSSEINAIASLENATVSDIQPSALASLYALGSDSTELQRDNKTAEIKGKVIDWTLGVYEVRKSGDNYRIQTSTGPQTPGTFITLTTRDQQEKSYIENLKTGSSIRIKGVINGVSMRSVEIEPALLHKDPISPVATEQHETPIEAEASQATVVEPDAQIAQSSVEHQADKPIEANSASDTEWSPPTAKAEGGANIQPSFDCTKATLPVEKMICGDPELVRLDQEMAKGYKDMTNLVDPDLLKKEQIIWINKRNTCSTNDCIKSAYKFRLDQYAKDKEAIDD